MSPGGMCSSMFFIVVSFLPSVEEAELVLPPTQCDCVPGSGSSSVVSVPVLQLVMLGDMLETVELSSSAVSSSSFVTRGTDGPTV